MRLLLVALSLSASAGFSPNGSVRPLSRPIPTSGQEREGIIRRTTRWGKGSSSSSASSSALHSFELRKDNENTIVKPFSMMEQLEELVELASRPLPNRVDGIVTIAKFTSMESDACQASELLYDALARKNPATLFLRSYVEYLGADQLFAQAKVLTLPTFDIFYQGSRVARIEGVNHMEVDEMLQRFQVQKSDLDLFSEDAARKSTEESLAAMEADAQAIKAEMNGEKAPAKKQPSSLRNTSMADVWGEQRKKYNPNKTPRTTNRFVPGYDWDKDRSFFDEVGDKMVKDIENYFGAGDFENQYENWVPPDLMDEDKDNKQK